MAAATAAYMSGCFAPAYKEVDSLHGKGGSNSGNATGGQLPTGGAPEIGGASATGGAQVTGGTGTLASGGSTATGGASTTGGTTATCTSTSFPVSCPTLGLTGASCWESGTACSTVTTCEGDSSHHGCTSSNSYYDCETGLCKQCTGSTPVACPALAGFTAGCWASGTLCTSLANCNGLGFSCSDPNDYFDCAAAECMHCSDPNYPVACPTLGSAAANCWPLGTACSTVAHCTEGDYACRSPNAYYDCATSKCVTCSGSSPVGCPSVNGVSAGCWTVGTVCSTITLCGESGKACPSPIRTVNCSTNQCVSNDAP